MRFSLFPSSDGFRQLALYFLFLAVELIFFQIENFQPLLQPLDFLLQAFPVFLVVDDLDFFAVQAGLDFPQCLLGGGGLLPQHLTVFLQPCQIA